jgi:hypothetical protein
LSLVLAAGFAAGAQAQTQQHRPQQAHPNAAAPHAGQGHAGGALQQRGISAEEMMMHEMWQYQMMFAEMERQHAMARAAQRRAAHQQSGSGQSQSAASVNGQSMRPQQGRNAQPGTLAGAQSQEPNNPSGKNAKRDAARARDEERRLHADEERRRREDAERRRRESILGRERREAIATGQLALPLASDRGTILVLRQVHASLHSADTDYQGHRERAMGHVATALARLGAPGSAMGGGSILGSGNLAQAQSDEILRDSRAKLISVERTLRSATIHEHHRMARVAVDEAISQLNVALKIR